MALPQLNLHNIKIISFDIWRTIIGLNPEFQVERKKLYFDTLKPKVNFEDFSKRFDQIQRVMEARSEEKGTHFGLRGRVAELCRQFEVPQLTSGELAKLSSTQAELCKRYPAPLLSQGIVDLFDNIQQTGRKIALLSNAGLIDSPTVLGMLDTHGVKKYVSYAIFSDENNLTKPNPLFFKQLLQMSGEPASNILHVGDSQNADYNGALAAGISALQLCLDDEGVLKLNQFLGLETK